MKCAILLASPDISGGSYVIFEHAIRMMEQGEEITIITETEFNKDRLNWHPKSKELRWETFESVKDETFDLAVATWWRTVYEIYRVNAVNYAYFVQSIESRFYSDNEKPLRHLVEATYTLPFNYITEAKWIQDYLKEHYNKDAFLVRNGVRKDIYFEDGECHAPRQIDSFRVLVEGPVDVDFKNVPKTIELCKQSNADEVWLLTSSPVGEVSGVDRVFSRVPIFETPPIYRSCDVIVKLSYVEGMFGPPLEMFHCGGTAITYNVTGHDEYLVDQVNSCIIERDDEQGVVAAINKMKEDKVFYETLVKNAKETAHNWFSWEQAAQEFSNALHKIINQNKFSKEDLFKLSKFHFDSYVIAENYRLEIESGKSMLNESRFQLLKNKIRNDYPRTFNYLKRIKIALKI